MVSVSSVCWNLLSYPFNSHRLNLGILDRCRDTSRTIFTLDHYFNFVASIEIGHFQLTVCVGLQSELLSRQGINQMLIAVAILARNWQNAGH